MLFNNVFSIFFLVILDVKLINSSDPSAAEDKMLSYERNVNTSLQLGKRDKVDLRSWSEDFQVQMVEVTTKYRLDMTRHQQHNFNSQLKNKRWQECLKFYERTTNKLEQAYYIKENACLRSASAADGDRRDAVLHIGKEIQKWRRTYRYLLKLCHNKGESNPDCIVNYVTSKHRDRMLMMPATPEMERDHFDHSFSVLLTFRAEAFQSLREVMTGAIETLDECLRATLSRHLESIRHARDVMSKCYG